MRLILAPLIAAIILAPAPALPASSITGPATVTDGNTIKINSQRIRLERIDAPGTHQTCKDADGRKYGCGLVSSAKLRAHIAGHAIDYQPAG